MRLKQYCPKMKDSRSLFITDELSGRFLEFPDSAGLIKRPRLYALNGFAMKRQKTL